MESDGSMDRVRNLMHKHGMLPLPGEFVTGLTKETWRDAVKLANIDTSPLADAASDGALTKFVTVLPAGGWRELTPKEAAARSDFLVPLPSRSLGKTSLFNDVMQAAADRIATLEAENATLSAQLTGKVSISCADAAAAIRNAPTLAPTTAKPAMPPTALAHRKPQIGLRTL